MNRFDDIPEQALKWHREGRAVALATVIQTWGSAPRRVGSMMVINDAGDFAGSVSGGCVEGAVVTEALDALETGTSRTLEYGVSDGDAFAVGLACGGAIQIWLDPIAPNAMPEADLNELVAKRAARQPVGYCVDSKTNMRRLCEPKDFAERFRADRSGLEPDGQTFVIIHNPPLRLVVVGAVHIAQALLPLARLVGYDPVIVDPREAFASDNRFPGEVLLHDWPDDAMASIGPDARTAVVLLTHDPKLDDPAIHAALGSDAFYIGALGSKRTHASRIERLTVAGFSADQIARIHGPVGLDIGSSTPEEIALSILAEMTAVLRQNG